MTIHVLEFNNCGSHFLKEIDEGQQLEFLPFEIQSLNSLGMYTQLNFQNLEMFKDVNIQRNVRFLDPSRTKRCE